MYVHSVKVIDIDNLGAKLICRKIVAIIIKQNIIDAILIHNTRNSVYNMN